MAKPEQIFSKNDVVTRVAQTTGISVESVEKVIDAAFREVASVLKRGEVVELQGLGRILQLDVASPIGGLDPLKDGPGAAISTGSVWTAWHGWDPKDPKPRPEPDPDDPGPRFAPGAKRIRGQRAERKKKS